MLGKIPAFWEKITTTFHRSKENLLIYPFGCDLFFLLYRLANIQCAGKRRCNLKTALLGKINGCVYIALFTGQLHTLDVLNQLAIFQTLILWQVFFRTVFAWRRNHGYSFPLFFYNCLKML